MSVIPLLSAAGNIDVYLGFMYFDWEGRQVIATACETAATTHIVAPAVPIAGEHATTDTPAC